ncbi:hypothetical protein KC19_12G152500 [Ceratodon purpureus]|uniref:Uncharacterized protein n=1 Tax=Ceratodon purpureus TaxID=3225 RepID=A0A8T0GDC1_CERPU|nr:hypothetical protein KC19_12G152500 [Ceratodon purpureus]
MLANSPVFVFYACLSMLWTLKLIINLKPHDTKAEGKNRNSRVPVLNSILTHILCYPYRNQICSLIAVLDPR